MERVPKNFMLSYQPIGVDPYIPIRTRDDVEADFRRAQRNTGALVMDEQGHGLQVVKEVLDNLEDHEDVRQFARLAGGSLLMTANYLFPQEGGGPMNRVVKLATLTQKDGEHVDRDDMFEATLLDIDNLRRDSREYAEHLRNRERIPASRLMRMAQKMGSVGARLAVTPLELPRAASQAEAQQFALRETKKMWADSIRWAHKLGEEPTIAQFAVPASKVGQYILTADNISNEVARTYYGTIQNLHLDIPTRD